MKHKHKLTAGYISREKGITSLVQRCMDCNERVDTPIEPPQKYRAVGMRQGGTFQ